MEYLVVKNWTEFQHYKDRNPPWIKFHRALLDDYEFSRLHDASKLLLILIWLLASQSEGRVPNDAKFLQAKLSLDKTPDLQPLVESGFLVLAQIASTALDNSKQVAPTTARLEEERREEESIARFGRFWAAYPRKEAKPKALKAFRALNFVNGDFEKVMAALEGAKKSGQWIKDSGKFIPHPATWLNGRRFEDEGTQAPRQQWTP